MFSRVALRAVSAGRASALAAPRAFAPLASAAAAAAAPARAHHLLVRRPAPAFSGPAVQPDGSISRISLDHFKGKYLVLFYYPLDFTFVCPTEIIDFSEHAEDFAAANCALVGASCDSEFSHHAWTNLPRKAGGLGKMKIPLLADVSKKIARAYGFLVEDEADDMNGVPLRGTAIIDAAGKLRHVSVNDAPVGRSVAEVLRLVKAFQHTDAHGEVCPSGCKYRAREEGRNCANPPGPRAPKSHPPSPPDRHDAMAPLPLTYAGTPGKKTMKADPTGSLEYFKTVKNA